MNSELKKLFVMKRFYVFLLLLTFSYSLRSCGYEDRVAVSGTVTQNGEPVSFGKISFTPLEGTDGLSSRGDIREGRFRIPAEVGPATGSYNVEIDISDMASKASVLGTKNTGEKLRGDEFTEERELLKSKVFQFKRVIEEGKRSTQFDFEITEESVD